MALQGEWQPVLSEERIAVVAESSHGKTSHCPAWVERTASAGATGRQGESVGLQCERTRVSAWLPRILLLLLLLLLRLGPGERCSGGKNGCGEKASHRMRIRLSLPLLGSAVERSGQLLVAQLQFVHLSFDPGSLVVQRVFDGGQGCLDGLLHRGKR